MPHLRSNAGSKLLCCSKQTKHKFPQAAPPLLQTFRRDAHWRSYQVQASKHGGFTGSHLRSCEGQAHIWLPQRVEDALLPAHSDDAVPREAVRAAECPPVTCCLHSQANIKSLADSSLNLAPERGKLTKATCGLYHTTCMPSHEKVL